jgi:hypothetical protein
VRGRELAAASVIAIAARRTGTSGARLMLLNGLLESLIEIVPEVFEVLDVDAEPEQAGR